MLDSKADTKTGRRVEGMCLNLSRSRQREAAQAQAGGSAGVAGSQWRLLRL